MTSTEVGFQPEPVLFRIPFVWNGPTNGVTLQIVLNVDEGVVFYLNGVELLRNNVPTNVTAVRADTRSQSDVVALVCQTNTLAADNFSAGTNWLAAAVVTSGTSLEGTAVFGCGVQATWIESTPLRPEPPPRRSRTRVYMARISRRSAS